MSKLIGDPEWVVQPDSPELSGGEGSTQITVKVRATYQGMLRNLPSYGSAFESDDPLFESYSWLMLTSWTITADAGRKTYTVTLVYSLPEGSDDDSTDSTVKQEVEYSTQDTDVPLAQHPNYRVNWNHVLLAKNGVSGKPSWWEDAVNTQISDQESQQYAWSKPGEKPPDGWFVLCAETKPGVESFRRGVTTVSEIRRSTSKNYLARSAKNDYTIQKPPDDFGRDGEWLRGGSSIRKTGKYWELSVSFLNAKTWDKDLYG